MRRLRIFLNWMTGYNFGDPRRNGEYRFLRNYIKNGMVVFDVGAHVGDYTGFVLSLTPDVEVHCFEPVPETFSWLQQQHGLQARVHLNPCGLSDKPGRASIKIYGERYGINSLYRRRVETTGQPAYANFREEMILLTTLDEYVASNQVARIDLLKVDVEGHELRVLQGATGVLAAGLVHCIQFEYSSAFVEAQATLREVYDLVTAYGYALFRLLPFGKLRIRSFEPVWGLENYQHSNWLAVRKSLRITAP